MGGGVGSLGFVPADPETPETIHHLALCHEWEPAVATGADYRRSTLGASLDEVGFIHCSFPHQVQRIADLVYRDRQDVVLLTIDPARLGAEVRVENLEGGFDGFPHIYGPLPVRAVIRAEAVPVDGHGRLGVASLLDDP